VELNPWDYMSDEDLQKFLTDSMNNENAPDRVFVINYLKEQHIPLQILDVGSGTGNMYLALKNSMLQFVYVGVDRTRKMVNFAKKRFPEAKPMFIQGDIYDLGFPDRMWKVVYCRHVLDHLPGYEKELAELTRVCSDCLVICLLSQLADKQEIKVIGKPPSQTIKGEFSQHFLNTYPRKPFMEALDKLGFNVKVDRLIQVGGYFKFYHLIIARRYGVEEIAKVEKLQVELDKKISELKAETK
jgi:ubiquinone/menaquinone biosynthesis C-methylase UbiE